LVGHQELTSNKAMQFGGGVMHARELFPGLLGARLRQLRIDLGRVAA
jgi:hypothetical protein